MGAYLSEPVREKESEEGGTDRLTFAATSMQGWRVNQEDAHNAILDFGENMSLFAVYDGHGGPEVAAYVANRFPSFLRELSAWREGRLEDALTQAFLDFDAHLTTAEAVSELRRLAGQPSDGEGGETEDNPDETAEERRLLVEEARMPIAQLFEKYGIDQGSIFISPNTGRLRSRRSAKKEKDSEAPVSPKVDESSDPEESGPGSKRKKSSPSPKKSPKKSKENGESAAKQPKLESTNGSSEEMESGSGVEVSATVSSTTTALRSPVGSPIRQRSSKSESDVRALKAEEEAGAAGPLANWSDMGVGGGSMSGAGRETPETATAASSGDEEKGEDDESDEDENFVPPAAAHSDEEEHSESEDDEEGEDDETPDEDEEEGEVEAEPEMPDEDDEDDFPMPSGDSPGVDSGTTACVVVIAGDGLWVANAGDSRAVLCRGKLAVDMSEDHKPEDEPERTRIEAAGGKITPDGRVNGGLNLSRALGDHFYKKTAGLPLAKQMISPLPDIRHQTLSPQDRFLVLACDGIWNSMESQEVVDFVASRLDNGQSLKAIAEEMCEHCLAPDASGDGTGCDNMTVVITAFKPADTANGASASHTASTTNTTETPDITNTTVSSNTDGKSGE